MLWNSWVRIIGLRLVSGCMSPVNMIFKYVREIERERERERERESRGVEWGVVV